MAEGKTITIIQKGKEILKEDVYYQISAYGDTASTIDLCSFVANVYVEKPVDEDVTIHFTAANNSCPNGTYSKSFTITINKGSQSGKYALGQGEIPCSIFVGCLIISGQRAETSLYRLIPRNTATVV